MYKFSVVNEMNQALNMNIKQACIIAGSNAQESEQYNRWLRLLRTLNEAQSRLYVADRAIELGRGGIKKLQGITGISKPTIIKGIKELRSTSEILSDESGRIRKEGGGRKKIEDVSPILAKALAKIMDENTAGDPMSLLKWTGKSTRKIADEMTRKGYPMSSVTVGRLLKDMGYSLQSNVKTKEGKQHPDRDGQFRYINEQIKDVIKCKSPVISVDAKKKENIGQFKNTGRTWRSRNKKKEVLVYDFPNLGVGKAIPYGTYDIQQNSGMVNVGITHDTAEFAVESIRRWWKLIGRMEYPEAEKLLICADGGGSNGSRVKAWKLYLQKLSDEFNLTIAVCHYPPGTSKWNKIEHRMFSFISMNWKGEPLISYETVVNMISSTTTRSGLKIKAQLDTNKYEIGIKISDREMNGLKIQHHRLYPQWNYTISPRGLDKNRKVEV